ncbi:Flp family type IVb pilin [Desulfofalx alkaliphila]|uniref:Flp family type IVb pilin n=1 Tax=Desulfofalx alkaliphila TaxID=105483 RepID=UPI003B75BC82
MLTNLYSDEDGQGMAEYGLIIALIAVVVIVALTAIGVKIRDKFEDVSDALS